MSVIQCGMSLKHWLCFLIYANFKMEKSNQELGVNFDADKTWYAIMIGA